MPQDEPRDDTVNQDQQEEDPDAVSEEDEIGPGNDPANFYPKD
jgi:hypothetical protein